MRRLLLILLLLWNTAWADITQQRFSFAQVFDVQWYISSGVLHASGFNYIYASQPSNARLTSTQTNAYASAGDYIAFFNSTTNPGTYGLAVYDPNGALVRVLNNTGTFTALANGAIFYNGAGMWGTLFTTAKGYNYGSSDNFTVTQMNPTNAQLQAYTPPTTQPLSAGQTASSGPTVTGTSTATVVTSSTSGSVISYYNTLQTTTTYSDGTSTVTNGTSTLFATRDMGGGGTITAGQQADVNLFNANIITDNKIYIRHTGNNDSVTIQQIGTKNLITGVNNQFAQIQDSNNYLNIKQGNGNPGKNEIDLRMTGGSNWVEIKQAWDGAGVSGGNNYALVNVGGFTNNILTQQTNEGGSGHFLEATVSGNYNTVSMTQRNDGTKQAFVAITGNNNSVTTTQSGSGQHYANVSAVGNGNTAVIDQTGSVANNASVTLVNAGAPASVNLSQTGGRNYSITQTCYTTCGTVTVRQ